MTAARGNRKVAVVGVSLSDCGRVDEATPYTLHAQAARRALADSGLDRSVVDGFASAGLGTLAPIEVAEYLGLRPMWVDSTSVGGATWEVMAAHAADAIAAGHANAVLLVYGSTARADIRAGRRTGNLSFGARGPLQFEVPYGHSLIAKYAMAAATCTSTARRWSSSPRWPCRRARTRRPTRRRCSGTRSRSTTSSPAR
jgi:acetyl-CoA acetyltransferase